MSFGGYFSMSCNRIRIMPASVLGTKNKAWNEWHGLLGGTLIEVYRKSTEVTTGTIT